jgi:predicted membrane channel-forming protein YqfA (hemolysin III family)
MWQFYNYTKKCGTRNQRGDIMIYLGATIGIVILEIIYHDMNKKREQEEKSFKDNV